MNVDAQLISRCFDLARNGDGFVSPNPMVGAVVVKDDRIVGEGYHGEFGGDHAEVVALKEAGIEADGATLYVNLAPCCHDGKTGPCTGAIIDSGVARVVYSCADPNPEVSRKSDELLRSAGVEIVSGVLADQGEFLNRRYLKWMKTGKPYLTVKVASTLDGKIATASGESKWITSEDARKFGHLIRCTHDAILVGAGTLLSDYPNLGLHGLDGSDPYRICLTSEQYDDVIDRTDLDFFRDENSFVARGLPELWQKCEKQQISSILIEGGSGVLTSFLNMKLVDASYLFYGYKILGDEHMYFVGDMGCCALSDALDLRLVDVTRFSESICLHFVA